MKPQRRGNYLDAIENISASGANRGLAIGRCPASRELPNDFKNVRHRALAVRRRSAIGRKERGFQRGEGNRSERFPSFLWCAFAYFRRTAKVSACPARGQANEINCPLGMRASHINNLPSAIILPLARYNKFLSLTFACAASTYFRYTTKVGKDVPKKGKTTVRSGFLPFLWNLTHLSTDRGSPPSLKRRGLTDTLSQRDSRAVGAVEIETSTSRKPR